MEPQARPASPWGGRGGSVHKRACLICFEYRGSNYSEISNTQGHSLFIFIRKGLNLTRLTALKLARRSGPGLWTFWMPAVGRQLTSLGRTRHWLLAASGASQQLCKLKPTVLMSQSREPKPGRRPWLHGAARTRPRPHVAVHSQLEDQGGGQGRCCRGPTGPDHGTGAAYDGARGTHSGPGKETSHRSCL